MCKGVEESIDYLFLHCPLVIGLWQKPFQHANECWVALASAISMFETHFHEFGLGDKAVTLWNCARLLVFWAVWLERNAGIFEGKDFSMLELWDHIYLLVSFWASSSKEFAGFLYLL